MNLASYCLLGTAVFAGGFVSGMAGFAFSAVAGAIVLHVFQPSEAVPLMMACSVGVQASTLVSLRNQMRWKESLLLIAGGLPALPVAVFFLQNTNGQTLRMAFGPLIALYSGYSLFRPALGRFRADDRHGRNFLIGFGGGLIGGLTAMPGALPTIWCDINGMPKDQQRGLVQPFIAVMQIAALMLMLSRHELPKAILFDLAVCLPPLALGTALGVLMFRRINEAAFRRVVLVTLLLSGLALVI
jgi:uncharacterized membrane protein YfcA